MVLVVSVSGLSETDGTGIFTSKSLFDETQPCCILISSAASNDVQSIILISFVTIWLPIGITAVCLIVPSVKTAMSVVPQPISIRQTPKSRSSSDRTASLEATG